MRHRIVSSRVRIQARPSIVYKFIEDIGNHQRLVPRASNWRGDHDSARYTFWLGPGRVTSEVRVVERIPGMRVCEEPAGPSPVRYRRWYKIQADDQASICEISMECEMSLAQRAFLAPLFRFQMERILRNLKKIMEDTQQSEQSDPSTAGR